jgi:hypothetical protein
MTSRSMTADPTMVMTTPSTAIAARLVTTRADAVNLVGKHLEKGLAIKSIKIKYPEDLDKARAMKLEWTQVMTDLLGRLFDNSSVADFCNDWVGKIFPEYAEFGNFVEQFYEEMEQRTTRLRAVFDQLNVAIEQAPIPSSRPLQNGPLQTESHANAAAPGHAHGHAPAPAPAAHAPAHAPHAPSSAAFAGPERMTRATKVKAMLALDGKATPYTDAIAKFLEQLGVVVVKVPATMSLVAAITKDADTTFTALLLDDGDVQADVPRRDERTLMFELGYCAGRVGAGRVCVLHPAGRAPMTGTAGVEHLGLDTTGGWQLQLARLMRRCGIEVDLNKLV